MFSSGTRNRPVIIDVRASVAMAGGSAVMFVFACLGSAYATSSRLAAIQEFTPSQSALAFVLLNGFTLVLAPFTARVIPDYNPRLGAGFLLMAIGAFWIATESAASMSLLPPPRVARSRRASACAM
ncbi:MAG TPA: hypothetical protein VJT49_31925 [Amycolatopsis sp.]|uniref:hypothetical protein n=1 Tax=Amycolatopsis sp. TaxID=37632 RepID=UPI002B48C085|nr:hypothetical protein [Amycolatopsis sp.]HKS49640.1 hypothetical protein [Amycolatopsis sp.]